MPTPLLVLLPFLVLLSQPVIADESAEWIRRWNREPGRVTPLKSEDVLFQASRSDLLPGLIAVGFRQSDGTYPLGRIIWKGEAYSPLAGFGAALRDLEFERLTDAEREELFLTLLQQTYGAVGVRPYTGPPSREFGRPRPLAGMRGPKDVHRFQVWFYVFPVETVSGEWREVLYVVSSDGGVVKARTLDSHRPENEGLSGFPNISEELFE